VKEQLAGKGEDAIPNLQALLHVDNEIVARHVREVLSEIDSRTAVLELGAMCDNFSESGDLEESNWLLARILTPGADIPAYRRQLDHWGERVAEITGGAASSRERIRLMSEFLGQGLNLHGNAIDYYDPQNSLLTRVIDTRLGIPISLSLLYILVGKRAGLEIEGVNFPGHFIVRHERVLFDPFERGRIITVSECEAILARQKMTAKPLHFQRATPLTIFTRMLANLLYIYQTEGDENQAARLSGWIRRLQRQGD
jgi:regulator of sirC expression with transglutaminase-like and TPR domain